MFVACKKNKLAVKPRRVAIVKTSAGRRAKAHAIERIRTLLDRMSYSVAEAEYKVADVFFAFVPARQVQLQ